MFFKSQIEMFNWIWDYRFHVSELSGEPLVEKGHLYWHWQFLHVLPKGSYPHYKLNSDNILLGTVKEHDTQEHFKVFQDKKQQLRQEYYEKYYNKTYETTED